MSKLDELIKELCPEGVEYKKLGDVCDIFTGGEAPEDSIKEKIPRDGYIYPIYSNGIGENSLWGYSKSYRIEKKAVTFSSIGTIGYPTIREPKFIPIIRLKVLIPKDDTILAVPFLKYTLEIIEIEKQKSSVPNINANMIKSLEIPVPPLQVQNEIVRILDKFTSLEAELEAELEARRKQYEYYRDSLLTFGDDAMPDGRQVEWKTIADISTVNRGIRVTRDMLSTEGSIPVYQNALAPLGYFEKANRKSDTTFVISAGAAGQIGYSGIDFWAADDCFTFDDTKNILSKYIFYFLQTKQSYIDSRVRRGSIPRISRDVFEKMKIPLPPLAEQERIVAILNRFESLCNDITSGLPAEIAARHKQYEYYRDKLLTFKRKEAL